MSKTAHLYRVGSREIGHGHVVRCRALANALVELGWTIEEYDNLDVLQPRLEDVVVVDSNEITKAEVLALRRRARVINLAARGEAKWWADTSFLATAYLEGQCPPGAVPIIHSGPEYQPILVGVLQSRRLRKLSNAPPRKILVAHGGSDPMGHTELTLEALGEVKGDRTVDVVLGRDFDRELEPPPGMVIHQDVDADQMAGLMVRADLGICSMGLTTYEACCVGLPTINICKDEFHREAAKRAQAKGFLWWVRPRAHLIAAALRVFGANEFQLRLTSRNALAYVTGHGAATVARMIEDGI